MRLLRRRRPSCDCRLCRPDRVVAAADRKTLSDVEQHDVQVVLVSDGHPCTCEDHEEHDHAATDEPDFAYTVGLWHQRRHPELLMSGIPDVRVMHHALNELAARVVAGAVLEPGVLLEDVLVGVPVTVERLTDRATSERVTRSAWFHRREVPALQVVWPDREGVFAWQGAAAIVAESQPEAWRVPGPRAGALAPEPTWPFPVARDALAFTCVHVLDGDRPALYVQRDADPERGEDWSVLCGSVHEGTAELVMAHLSHLVVRSPALRDVADLPLGWVAERADAQSEWARYVGEPEE